MRGRGDGQGADPMEDDTSEAPPAAATSSAAESDGPPRTLEAKELAMPTRPPPRRRSTAAAILISDGKNATNFPFGARIVGVPAGAAPGAKLLGPCVPPVVAASASSVPAPPCPLAVDGDELTPAPLKFADSLEELPFPGFYDKVFRCLSQRDHPRDWCLKLLTWHWFERISMGIILLNCITLGLYQPCEDQQCLSVRCKILDAFDHFIFIFFTLEMTIKMIAMGIFGKLAYMGDQWNRLDCFIVFAGFMEYLPYTRNLSLTAIRTIRVLRPLRAINRIPSMRILVMLLLDTLPMLVNVLILCFFVFFIFGIVGVQLWAGALRHRCFVDFNHSAAITFRALNLSWYYRVNKTDVMPFEKDFICTSSGGGMQTCDEVPPSIAWNADGRTVECKEPAAAFFHDRLKTNSSICVNWNQYYTRCLPGERNPFLGAINFDNIGFAWIAIFQVISLESWVDIMYYVQDAHSFWDWIYFVALIVIGSFFMVNLCLVVIATQFSETKKRETERMQNERKRYQSSSTLASSPEPQGCYMEMIRLVFRYIRRGRKAVWRRFQRWRGRGLPSPNRDAEPPKNCGPMEPTRASMAPRGSILITAPPGGLPCYPFVLPAAAASNEPRQPPFASPEASEVDVLNSPRRLPVPNARAALRRASAETPTSDNSSTHFSLPVFAYNPAPATAAVDNVGNSVQVLIPKGYQLLIPHVPVYPVANQVPAAGGEQTTTKSVSSDEKEEEEEEEKPRTRFQIVKDFISGCFRKVRHLIFRLVEHRFFQRSVLLAILFNTLSMGIEHHNQPEQLTQILEYSNILFSGFFLLEMVLKVLGVGVIGYISNGFNVFDGVIVILSIVELCQGGTSGLSVLRTFRLLRILKLVRFMPALRQQLVVMLRTMDNVATFFALLVLFIFIFR